MTVDLQEEYDDSDWASQGMSWANDLSPSAATWVGQTRRNGNPKYKCSDNGVLELTPIESANTVRLAIQIRRSYRYAIHISDDPTASGLGESP